MSGRGLWKDRPLILAYHSVNTRREDGLAVGIDDFRNQMSWLQRRGYRSMTLRDFTGLKIEKGGPLLIITFDDGYADNYSLAFPILKEYGFVATVFLVSDYVNTDHIFSWDEAKVGPHGDPSLYRLLNWEEIREMAGYGIEFGSHTCTHPELTKLSTKQSWEEVTRSRVDLEARLGREIASFCYPDGDLNPEVVQMVEQAGYRSAVVTPPRAGIPLSRYTLRRVGIYQNNRSLLFRLKTMPFVRRKYYERLGGFPWKRKHGNR